MDDERAKRRKKFIIIGSIVAVVVIYLIGIITQYANPELRQKTGGSVWNPTPEIAPVSFNPIRSFAYALTTNEGRMICLLAIGLTVGIFIFIRFSKDGSELKDERNFNRSTKGTYGTSGWMTNQELKAILDWKPIKDTTGTILGVKDGKIVSLPVNSKLNKHTAIYGASGTGKSRCFVRPQILQCVARGESVIITDPKGEIYADTAEFMRRRGYDVKMFNLVDPKYSDSWNCLSEITANPESIELMAQTFVEVIIKNTGDAGGDKFWDNAESNLLKALCLYVCLDEARAESAKNIGAVYEMLTNNDEKKLNAMFDKLPIGHPARQPWSIFKQAGDNVRGNTIIGLGARLQVFQSDIIRKITMFNEIDLEGPAKRKSAYFVIMSDQDSTLDFLSSLFFSFLFIKLVRYADVKGKDGKCDVYVNFILDEFPNIGSIPDFTKKLSTIRSRELRVAVIFQNIAQLQNRYPDGLWEEIVGNCDTQLFLGCTDQMTAKFISTRTGEMTIEVVSQGVSKDTMAVAQTTPSYKETQSVGKRFVLTPDEVMRLPNTNALIILRGQKVLKVDKFDFSNHPGAANFIHSYVRDYVPQWRAALSSKKFAAETQEAIEEASKNTFLDTRKDPPLDTEDKNDKNNGMGGSGGSTPTMSNASRNNAPMKSRRTISKINLFEEEPTSNGEIATTVPAARTKEQEAQEALLNSINAKKPAPATVKTSSGKKMYSKLPDDF